MTDAGPPTPAALAARLAHLTLGDERRLGRRLEGLRRIRQQGKRTTELADLAGRIDRAEQAVARRALTLPEITFPPDLPVSARVDDVAAAIADHQVVILAGETGSGKSTQLPKICLRMGRGVRGMIGHTQPRRIAARALAERIAEETGTELGGAIGYAIRFGDHTGPNTLVKLMTDGILLAEVGRDRDLLAYDTIIIDEAHERSLNIDFLLGYLTELLPRRPDLKVIITSATIDPQRFSRHFGDAPIVEVSGRMYPVEVRYRPFGPLEGTDDGADTAEDAEGGADGEPTRLRAPSRAAAPRGGANDIDQATAICRAVDELAAAGDGDVLVFLSGEREITDTAEVLRGHLAGSGSRLPTEVLPLYGRLSMADQHRVFSSHSGRRVVLATNVAETSLTVPGIRYVVDPGTARISRYSPRTKVQRLPIEKVSRASAGQRAGRCGRVADGICIRLYSEDDFADRPEFTDPEIARTSLASVILQMAALDLGDIASFPFVEPPDRRQISDGITVLEELGALEPAAGDRVRLTATGRSLAALPVDPRLARMIVEADLLGCLPDVLIIVAALAIQDVREYPLEERDRAKAAHSRFVDKNSDFLALLNLWRYLADQARESSGSAFRRMCRREYLNYLRIREWQDLHGQLSQIARGLGMTLSARPPAGSVAGPAATARAADSDRAAAIGRTDGRGTAANGAGRRNDRSKERGKDRRKQGIGGSAFSAAGHRAREQAAAAAAGAALPDAEPAGSTVAGGVGGPGAARSADATQQGRGSLAPAVDSERIHQALLAGLLSHVGLRLEPGREYQGARGTKFVIWPGSALASAGPRFVVAAELVETSRLWGRLVARIDPAWAEQVGGHLVKRQYAEPHWAARRGSVMATERVTLLGITLVAGRPVQYDHIDPELARELFIRHALVEGDWQTRHRFLAANAEALAFVAEQEDRVRRRDIRIDDDALFALYDARIPPAVTSGQAFDAWWKTESRAHPALLTFTPDMLVEAGAELVSEHAYPDRFTSGGVDLDLDYVFEPGRPDDGVTVTIPLAVLARVDPDAFSAQIPGLREELAIALLRTLPKSLRRNFVPAPDFARAALARMGADRAAGALPGQLAAELVAMTGIPLTAGDFVVDALPPHLRMTYRVVDEAGEPVASGKDLVGLREELRGDTRQAVARLTGDLERRGLTSFPDKGVPADVVREVDGHQVVGYPALVDEGVTVGVTVFTSPADQARAMRAGTRRLLALGARSPLGFVKHELARGQVIALATAPQGSLDAVVADATLAAIDALLDWAGGPATTADGFRALATKIAPHLDRAVADVVIAGAAALQAAHRAQAAIEELRGGTAAQQADLKLQLASMIGPDFLTRTSAAHLPDLQRWLDALTVRAQRIKENPQRDADRMVEVITLATEIDDAVAALPPDRRDDGDVASLRRMLAEFRVATFAQPMRTALPVSAKRIRSAIAGLRP